MTNMKWNPENVRLNDLWKVWFLHDSGQQHLESGVAKYGADELLCFFCLAQQKRLQLILGLCYSDRFFLDLIPRIVT